MHSADSTTCHARGRQHRRRELIALLLLTACMAGLLRKTQAGPMDSEIEFHISPGSLERALLQFSRQAHIPVTLAAHVTGNLQTPGLAARLPVTTALERLLQGSGLAFQIIGDTVTIVRESSPAEARVSR